MLRTDGQWYSVPDLLLNFGLIRRASDTKILLEALSKARPDLMSKIEVKTMFRSEVPAATIKVCTDILLAAGVSYDEIMEVLKDDPYYFALDALSKGFYDCEPCQDFYCNTKTIDLYLAKPRIAIILIDDPEIEGAIKSALGCSVIHGTRHSIGEIIATVRQMIVTSNLRIIGSSEK
jgi:hypothetical protein